MPDTLDLLTLEEGLTAVNISAGNADHDAEVAQQITAVSRVIDAECGPVVHRTITAELHDGGARTLFLRNTPVASVTLLRSATGGTITTLPSVPYGGVTDGYTLMDGQLYRTSGGWSSTWGSGQVEVTYVAGRYATTALVDARFKTCAASVLRRLWKRESGTWAQSSNFLEDQAVGVGFFRVAKPIIDEMLSYELRLPGVA